MTRRIVMRWTGSILMNIPEAKKKVPVGSVHATSAEARWDGSERLTLSVEQAGRLLGLSRGAAYARAVDGSLPTVRLGKRLLVPKSALQKMLQVD
jgi:excisionase family DNA binding protein